jgi:hypothetical protein
LAKVSLKAFMKMCPKCICSQILNSISECVSIGMDYATNPYLGVVWPRCYCSHFVNGTLTDFMRASEGNTQCDNDDSMFYVALLDKPCNTLFSKVRDGHFKLFASLGITTRRSQKETSSGQESNRRPSIVYRTDRGQSRPHRFPRRNHRSPHRNHRSPHRNH